MSRIDFFNKECQEPPTTARRFGLCDDQDGKRAYTDLENEANWIATVKNERAKEITFTAIDKCLIKNGEQPGRGRCDGMLTTDEHLFFIELKNQQKGWKSAAMEQLESTVQFFMENHPLNVFRHKKVFACNKKHTRFQEVDTETKLRFFRKYSFRLDVQAEIILI